MSLRLNSCTTTCRRSQRIQFTVPRRVLTGMSKDDDESLLRRFESHLPKYGTLWKSMVPKGPFLSAIESKRMISVRVGNHESCPLYGCSDGSCSAPIHDEYESSSQASGDGSTTVAFDSAPIHEDFETSSQTSSGGSTTIAFDLSNLRIHDDDVEDTRPTSVVYLSVGEHSVPRELDPGGGSTEFDFDPSDGIIKHDKSGTQAEDLAAKGLTKHQVEVAHTDESYEYIDGEPFQIKNDQSGRADDHSSSDDSSGGSTVIRFDISHLQDEHDSTQVHEELENLPPLSPSLNKMSDQYLVDTPVWKKGGMARLVEDGDSTDSSWVTPKDSSKHLEIVSGTDSESEVQWTDLVDSDMSDEESLESVKTIISICDDGSRSLGSPATRALPRKPLETLLSKGHFRKNRERLTREAFEEFNKVVFDEKLNSITVAWSSKLRTTAGVTRCTKDRTNPGRRFAAIELSVKVIDGHQRLRHTILHEMCHAAQWLVDGKINPPHGACFKKWANLAMSKVQGAIVTTTHNFAIQYKYAWACTTERCGVVFQRQSKSIDVDKHACGKCNGRLMEINVPEKGEIGRASCRERVYGLV